MPRYFLHFSFNGSRYHGWQIQQNAYSVQEQIQKSLSVLFNQKIQAIGCGRTDTGVHAKSFYAHFDADKPPSKDFIYHLNCILPKDIAAYNLFTVSENANARFDALYRTYQYKIHTQKNPFYEGFSLFKRGKINVSAIQEVIPVLLGKKDFSCFSKSRTQVKNNFCEIHEASFKQIQEHEYIFEITANRFLRGMVRAIVGTLLNVSDRKLSANNVQEILFSKNRSNAGESVLPCGLYLTHIEYPKNLFLASH